MDLTGLAATVGSNVFISEKGDTAVRKIFAVITSLNVCQEKYHLDIYVILTAE